MDDRGWCSPIDPRAIPACAAHMMLVDARGWDALPWTHERLLLVAAHRMLVDARGWDALPWTMGDPRLCSA